MQYQKDGPRPLEQAVRGPGAEQEREPASRSNLAPKSVRLNRVRL